MPGKGAQNSLGFLNTRESLSMQNCVLQIKKKEKKRKVEINFGDHKNFNLLLS